jgi:viroplasmin and RNaseH domain-containing protein
MVSHRSIVEELSSSNDNGNYAFYAVARGRLVGVFPFWTHEEDSPLNKLGANSSTLGFNGALHHGFNDYDEALDFVKRKISSEVNSKNHQVMSPAVRATRDRRSPGEFWVAPQPPQ